MKFKNNHVVYPILCGILFEDYCIVAERQTALTQKAACVGALLKLRQQGRFSSPCIDDEWFLNDLKNHDHQSEPRLSCYDIRLHYTYRTRNCTTYSAGQMSYIIDKLLTDFGRETILSILGVGKITGPPFNERLTN